MFAFRHDADRSTARIPSTPGTWWFEGNGVDAGVDARRLRLHLSVVCACPACGRDSTVSLAIHSIANDGSVSPSYVCPHGGCPFHEFVVLGGWFPPDPRTI